MFSTMNALQRRVKKLVPTNNNTAKCIVKWQNKPQETDTQLEV